MQKEKNPEEMLNANDAGKILGVSGKTIIRLMEGGDVPGYRIGGVWKFKRGEVEHYRDSQRYRPGGSEKEEEAA
jgi:excisionase family DNA binding protein